MEDPKRQNELIAGIRAGDPESARPFFEEVAKLLTPFVRRRIAEHVSSRFDADDVVQETLVQLISTIREGEQPIKYLDRLAYTIARHVISNWLRRRSARFQKMSPLAGDDEPGARAIEPPATGPGAHTQIVQGERDQLLHDAMDALTPQQALVVRLRLSSEERGQKMTFEEIGEVIGISDQAAEKHYLRAKEKIRTHLKRNQLGRTEML